MKHDDDDHDGRIDFWREKQEHVESRDTRYSSTVRDVTFSWTYHIPLFYLKRGDHVDKLNWDGSIVFASAVFVCYYLHFLAAIRRTPVSNKRCSNLLREAANK
jgi:hypothetical protein